MYIYILYICMYVYIYIYIGLATTKSPPTLEEFTNFDNDIILLEIENLVKKDIEEIIKDGIIFIPVEKSRNISWITKTKLTENVMIIIKNATNKNSKINNATKKIAKKAFDRR